MRVLGYQNGFALPQKKARASILDKPALERSADRSVFRQDIRFGVTKQGPGGGRQLFDLDPSGWKMPVQRREPMSAPQEASQESDGLPGAANEDGNSGQSNPLIVSPAITSPAEIMAKRRQAILERDYITKTLANGETEVFTGQSILALVHGVINEKLKKEPHNAFSRETTKGEVIGYLVFENEHLYREEIQEGLDTAISDLLKVQLLSTIRYNQKFAQDGAGMVTEPVLIKTDWGRKYCGEATETHSAQSQEAQSEDQHRQQRLNERRKLARLRMLVQGYGPLNGWQLLQKIQEFDKARSWVSQWFFSGISERKLMSALGISGGVSGDQQSFQKGVADLKSCGLIGAVEGRPNRIMVTPGGDSSLREGNPLDVTEETQGMILRLIEEDIAEAKFNQDEADAKYARIQRKVAQATAAYEEMAARCQTEKDRAWALIQEAETKTDPAEKEALEKEAARHASAAADLEVDLEIEAAHVKQLPQDELDSKKALEKIQEALQEKIRTLSSTHAKVRRLASRSTVEEAIRQLESLRNEDTSQQSLATEVGMRWQQVSIPEEEIAVRVTANRLYEASLDKLKRERLLDKIRREKSGTETEADPSALEAAVASRSQELTLAAGTQATDVQTSAGEA